MNIKRIGLNKMIQIGFVGVISLMIINGAASFMVTNKLVQSTSWVTHTYEVQAKLANIVSRLVDAETGQRGFLYTSKEAFLEPYMKSLPLIPEEVSATMELVKDNPAQVQRLKIVNDLAKQKLDELSKTISLHKAGKNKEALLVVESGAGKKIMDDMRVEISPASNIEIADVEFTGGSLKGRPLFYGTGVEATAFVIKTLKEDGSVIHTSVLRVSGRSGEPRLCTNKPVPPIFEQTKDPNPNSSLENRPRQGASD